MAVDVTLGKTLAANINAAAIPKVNAQFTFDPFLDSDAADYNPRVTIAPGNLQHERESRDDWRRDVSLLLTMIVKQPPNYDADWFDNYLTMFDDLIDVCKADALVDSIEITNRYQLDQSQTQARLMMQATLNLNFN